MAGPLYPLIGFETGFVTDERAVQLVRVVEPAVFATWPGSQVCLY